MTNGRQRQLPLHHRIGAIASFTQQKSTLLWRALFIKLDSSELAINDWNTQSIEVGFTHR
jgi:hypothetical protein